MLQELDIGRNTTKTRTVAESKRICIKCTIDHTDKDNYQAHGTMKRVPDRYSTCLRYRKKSTEKLSLLTRRNYNNLFQTWKRNMHRVNMERSRTATNFEFLSTAGNWVA